MASSSSIFFSSTPSAGNRRRRPRRSPLQIRGQSYRSDEGRGRHIVDENLQVLRGRIEEVRVRERLERCLESEFGWNYNITKHEYKQQHKKEVAVGILVELLCNVGGTVGFTILGCSFCLCLTSFIIHFPH